MLQRQAGNQAVAQALQHADDSDPESTSRGVTGAAPALAVASSGFSGTSSFYTGFEDPGAHGLSQLDADATSGVGQGTSTFELLGAGLLAEGGRRKWRRGRADLSDARALKDAAAEHSAERDVRSGRTDLAEHGLNAGGKALKIGASTAKMAFTGASATALGIGGAVVGLPAQLIGWVRSLRKLGKQSARFDRLKKLQLTTYQDPEELLAAAQASQAAVRSDLEELSVRMTVLGRSATPEQLSEIKSTRHHLEGRLRICDAQVADATKEKKAADTVKQKIVARFPGATTAPTLAEIAEYAKAKQKRGVIKKTIASVGSTVGLTGSAVALAAAIGTGAGLVLTPVGWGLAAAAAVVGLGVAGYKLVKRFRKFAAERRRENEGTGKVRSRGDKVKDFGRNLKNALNWRKPAPSERTAYAESLLDYFTEGSSDQKEQARTVIIALLGIEKSKRREDRLAAMVKEDNRDKMVKLLAAKMAS